MAVYTKFQAWKELWNWLTRGGTTDPSSTPPDVITPKRSTVYDNAEWDTGVVTDYDVSSNQSSAFNNVTTAYYVSIRTDAAITVKLNDSSNDGITVAANTTFSVEGLAITNIYITAASTAAVKIYMQ